jgi:DNA-binding response OmpR family regulator
VVDDDQLICELVQVVLAAESFHVLIATTGPEALALFRQHAAKIRAVLLNLWMPGISGKSLGQEIYRTHPGTRIILITGVTAQAALASASGATIRLILP